MTKAKFVLLLVLFGTLTVSHFSQVRENITVSVSVVDADLTIKNVPKFAFLVRSFEARNAEATRVFTSAEGKIALQLSAGRYLIESESPLAFQGRSFTWSVPFTVENGKTSVVELGNDNASIAQVSTGSSKRDISRGGEMFKFLRDGVVTVQGELGPGTGFIVDEKGLVLTNHHVIDQSNEIRVRFDKYSAVKARLIAVDEQRDLAVLQINMQAFPNSRVLPIARANVLEPPVIEGEHVFTIGSPLNQEKLLSTGIASKVQERAIITDLNFNAGNSGAPLFNSIGQIVGIASFKVKDRSVDAFAGNQNKSEDSGLSGVVAIDEAAELIAKARTIVAAKGLPSSELMPNMPDGTFPIETIKTALSSKGFPLKTYVTDVKNYQIKYMTPVYKFYVMDKDRIESLNNRRKRNKDKGMTDTADPFRDLRNWGEYAGELQAVVQILALPETGASGASMLLSVLSSGTVGISTPLDEKYKADFYQMKLMCNGKEVVPLIRNKTEIVRELKNYYKERKRYTYAGVYSYPYEVFAPGQCSQMQVQVFSEEDIETPVTSDVPEATKNRIWADFKDFRTSQIASNKN